MTQHTPYNHPAGIPYSQEAEEAVIGAVLMNPEAFPGASTVLKPDDFYIVRHAYIWQALIQLSEADEVIDNITLAEKLRVTPSGNNNGNRLADIGGPAYITQLINSAPVSYNAMFYARLVERAAIRRRLLVAADEIKGLALDEADTDIDTLLSESFRRIEQAQPERRTSYLPGGQSINAYVNTLDNLVSAASSGEMLGVPMPEKWHRFADYVPVVMPGWFCVVTGGSGGGKSAWLESWAEHTAALGLPTEYIHTEMSTDDMLHRRMARHSGFPYHMLATGQVDSNRTAAADEKIKAFAPQLAYNHMPDVRFEKLAAEMRLSAKAGVKVFFIDHFQDIVPPSAGKNDNPQRLVEQMCTWLAAFAETRKVIVIVASQVNQRGDTKWTKKLIEKAALWISLTRKPLTFEQTYVYNGVEVQLKQGQLSAKADVAINKARFGSRGKFQMLYHGPGFNWLDVSAVSIPARAGKIVPISDATSAEPLATEQIPF